MCKWAKCIEPKLLFWLRLLAEDLYIVASRQGFCDGVWLFRRVMYRVLKSPLQCNGFIARRRRPSPHRVCLREMVSSAIYFFLNFFFLAALCMLVSADDSRVVVFFVLITHKRLPFLITFFSLLSFSFLFFFGVCVWCGVVCMWWCAFVRLLFRSRCPYRF